MDFEGAKLRGVRILVRDSPLPVARPAHTKLEQAITAMSGSTLREKFTKLHPDKTYAEIGRLMHAYIEYKKKAAEHLVLMKQQTQQQPKPVERKRSSIKAKKKKNSRRF